MSDDENVIQLKPDFMKLESLPKNEQEEYLIENRDEMLEVLNGLIGRIHAFDIRGLIILGFSKNVSDDVVYMSSDSHVQLPRSVCGLEMIKQMMIQNRLQELAYENTDI